MFCFFLSLCAGSDSSGPLTVELSGPSADLTIKRRSMQMPGSDSFSAVASAFAGNSFAGRSAQSAPPRLAPPFFTDMAADDSTPLRQMEAEPQQQQHPQQQRAGLKKGMKGLAKRFKQLLGGRQSSSSSQQRQQQLQQTHTVAQPPASFAGRMGSSASAPAAVTSGREEAAVGLLAHIEMDYSAEGMAPGTQQFGGVSVPSSARLASITAGYAGPHGVSSCPSWSAAGAGNMTGRGQQQQQQQHSFVSTFNSFGGTAAGSFGGPPGDAGGWPAAGGLAMLALCNFCPC